MPTGSPKETPKMPLSLARNLTRFVLNSNWIDLPDSVKAAAVRANMNWLACALAGSQTPTFNSALGAAQVLSSRGELSLIGRHETVDASQAVFLNCLSSAAHAFDDTHLKTITHPTGPVAATVWTLAEQLSKEGKFFKGHELMAALILGMEVECRMSNAIVNHGQGAHIGWYMTGLTGGIGSAAAASKLLGLTENQTVMALSLASAQSGGFRATHGSMGTAFVPAMAARNGLAATRLAQQGFNCTEHCLDGTNGLLAVLSDHCDATLALKGLGQIFEVMDNALKPYPCGIVIHPAIDTCIALHQQGPWAVQDVESVTLWVHEDTLRLCGRRLTDTVLDTQNSLYHWAAASLIYPNDVLDNYELPRVMDPKLRDLQTRIEANVDSGMQSDQARAQLRTRQGAVFNASVEHASASAANPMTDEQLNNKFMKLAQRVFSESQALSLKDMSWHLPELIRPLEWFEKSRSPSA
ncbi:MAG: MmgE/PrpD family protein [Burkholderiaceae bacterium]